MEMTFDEAKKFFSELFYGEHHIPSKLEKCGFGWSVKVEYFNLATTDFNNLTRFVLMCHEYCIRGEIRGKRTLKMPTLEIVIHKRDPDKSGITSGHPTIQEAIESFNKRVIR